MSNNAAGTPSKTQNWQRLGCILEPALLGFTTPFAAVPMLASTSVTLPARLYFTTRDADNRSMVCTALLDIKDGAANVSDVSRQPILSAGETGYFDDAGAMGNCLLEDASRLLLYYQGWNTGVSVPFRNAIGLAISHDDGLSFKRHSCGPIMDRSPHDPTFTATPSVLKEADAYRMWYLSGVRWQQVNDKLKHFYHIKYAESRDGINWQRDGHVCIDFDSADEYAFSTPRVIIENGTYKMWYSFRGESYRIGYAESSDGKVWTRMDSAIQFSGAKQSWESEMCCYPFVFDALGHRYMLYNGNGYGASGIGLAVLD